MATPVSQTAAARVETMEQSVSASGTVTPTVPEEMSYAASGTVTGVHVVAATVGSIGLLTEITAGIHAGDHSILADLNAAMARPDTETDSGLSGLVGETSTETRTPPAGLGRPPAGQWMRRVAHDGIR